MPTASIKKDTAANVTVVQKIRDYSQDPFIKKKAERAKAFIAKHGLPKGWGNSKNKK
jgi:hypothetical protein